jgi:hypothetical protein
LSRFTVRSVSRQTKICFAGSDALICSISVIWWRR